MRNVTAIASREVILCCWRLFFNDANNTIGIPALRYAIVPLGNTQIFPEELQILSGGEIVCGIRLAIPQAEPDR